MFFNYNYSVVLGIPFSLVSIINYKKPAIVLNDKGISNGTTFVSWQNVKAINYMVYLGKSEQLYIKYFHKNGNSCVMVICINDLTESSESIRYAISRFSKIS